MEGEAGAQGWGWDVGGCDKGAGVSGPVVGFVFFDNWGGRESGEPGGWG